MLFFPLFTYDLHAFLYVVNSSCNVWKAHLVRTRGDINILDYIYIFIYSYDKKIVSLWLCDTAKTATSL